MAVLFYWSDVMRRLLKHHNLNLIQARHKKIIEDTFDSGLGEWQVVSGDWHHVTVDSNADDKMGIEGGVLFDSAGSYSGGVVKREIELATYGEILFERYVKNDDVTTGKNKLNFYIDDVLKFSLDGPTSWRRVEPIGVSPGAHTVKFEYVVEESLSGKSGIFDTFTVWEGRPVDAVIAKHTPPKPIRNISENKTLRGHTRFQEMTASDTEISFSAMFNGHSFLDFIVNSNEIFYFVDEFGVCYRGIFPNSIEPESKVLKQLYYTNLSMIAPQKAGVGFV